MSKTILTIFLALSSFMNFLLVIELKKERAAHEADLEEHIKDVQKMNKFMDDLTKPKPEKNWP